MRVLIQNEARSEVQYVYDKKTFEMRGIFAAKDTYPFPNGIIIGTENGDDACLECFLLTDDLIPAGTIVDAQPVGMFKRIEDQKEDYSILAVPGGVYPEMTAETHETLKTFVSNVFAELPRKSMTVGRFLGKDAAWALIAATRW